MPINISQEKKVFSSIRRVALLSFLFVLYFAFSAAGRDKKHKKGVATSMIVAVIRPASKEDSFITVCFTKSARFYKLPKNANPRYIALLQESAKNKSAVTITRANEQSDIILSVTNK
jgi:hypothetical protein